MTPLRWTVVATQVPASGSLGGVVRYTTEFVRALRERDDVIVSVIGTRAARATLTELIGDPDRVFTVPDAPTAALSLAERYAPLPGTRDADVVHGIKHLLPRKSRALRVLTVHDMLLLDRPADFGLAKRGLLPGPYRASIRDADLLLCVSEATRARLARHVPSGADRAEVVHLATSSSLREATPRALPALAGRRFALVVGDPTPRKNLRTVIEAWSRVRADAPDAVLAVAGPPSWGRTEVGPTYDKLVAEGALVAAGHVPDDQLRWAYENATVVLAPSLAEGFGLPAAEALEFGAPVIVSDDPALGEVAGDRARAVLPARDGAAWAAAAAAAFVAPAPAAPAQWPGRSWSDVVNESVEAARRALHRTGRA